jgi:transposase
MSLLGLFIEVDDFCQEFENWAASQQLPGKAKRGPVPLMSASEVMTIVIHFHQAGYRDFKSFYQKHVCKHLTGEFPGLVSYGRFVELMPNVLLVLCAYLRSRFGRRTGIAFIDSTPLAVCHNRRISRHRVFKNLAARGKSTMGWFYGFKLHLVVSEQGELLAVHLTPGNVDDRKPLQRMSKDLFGKLFGDKGYLSQTLFETLYERGLELITSLRKNMKGQLMRLSDRLLLRKRFIIETITDQLKNISQIEHTRHRSPVNFAVNLLAALIAYTHQPKKPS